MSIISHQIERLQRKKKEQERLRELIEIENAKPVIPAKTDGRTIIFVKKGCDVGKHVDEYFVKRATYLMNEYTHSEPYQNK